MRTGRHVGLVLIAVLMLVAGVVTGTAAPPAEAAVPQGFTDQLVATVSRPTSLAFTPDGRMVITTQTGTVRIITAAGALVPTSALDLGARVCTNNERGILGLAVDPQFASNHFIYLYWTFAKFNSCATNTSAAPVNRVARYVLGDNNVINPLSETLLIDNIPSPSGFHNAGDLEFGKDGYLYVTIGEGGQSFMARRMDLLAGKVLRITRNGGIPSDNPFTGANTDPCRLDATNTNGATCQEIYATGLRNPFRMAHNPNVNGVQVYVNDVGQNNYEEVNLLVPGGDYGWNLREGPCVYGAPSNCGPPPNGLLDPIHSYPQDEDGTMCGAITGGAFVPTGVWGPTYAGDYLFSDYKCGTIFRLEPNAGGGLTKSQLVTGLGQSSAVHLQFGPYQNGQALYYTVFGTEGQIRRLSFTSGNVPPSADLTADPMSGDAPLDVTLDGSRSFDPEGGPLRYLWNFGDGQTAETTTPIVVHTYAAGSYTASLRVRDNANQTSSPVTAFISSGNERPTATITAPAAGSLWRVNQRVTLTGSATDPEQGALPDSALTWTVLLHHNDDHVHPLLLQSGNNLQFTFPAPEDFQATAGSYVEIILEATDAGGLTAAVSRNIQPRRVNVTLASNPTGRRMRAHGEGPFTGPTTLVSWAGWRFQINALSPQDGWAWVSWSDGSAAIHAVTTPTTPITYTATYRRI